MFPGETAEFTFRSLEHQTHSYEQFLMVNVVNGDGLPYSPDNISDNILSQPHPRPCSMANSLDMSGNHPSM